MPSFDVYYEFTNIFMMNVNRVEEREEKRLSQKSYHHSQVKRRTTYTVHICDSTFYDAVEA